MEGYIIFFILNYYMMDNIIIGKNNNIDDGVIMHNNVIIGDNNIIKKGTIIYENTKIGNNNIILEDNLLGILPVEANVKYCDICRKGLIIGNNNFFHIKNIISSGYYNKTIIGNHNKLLAEIHISHDNIIHDHVTFYPRAFSAGLVEFFDNSNIGAGAFIQQRCKIGSYSMIGMNGVATKNVLPFMICINNKYIKLNEIKFTDKIKEYRNELLNILNYLKKNDSKYSDEINILINEIPLHELGYMYQQVL